jgi:hypothetical protein
MLLRRARTNGVFIDGGLGNDVLNDGNYVFNASPHKSLNKRDLFLAIFAFPPNNLGHVPKYRHVIISFTLPPKALQLDETNSLTRPDPLPTRAGASYRSRNREKDARNISRHMAKINQICVSKQMELVRVPSEGQSRVHDLIGLLVY